MKTLVLERDFEKQAAKLVGQFAAPSHVSQTIDRDTKLITTDGGAAAVLLRDVIPAALHLLAFELLKSVNGLVSGRPAAMGTRSLPRSINKDNVLSPRHGVNNIVVADSPARQGILGYDSDHRTSLTKEHPEMLFGNRELFELADSLYKRHLPTFYAKQLAEIRKAARCRLWKTVFTSAYVARNFRTAYHSDSNNLRGVLTALMPMGRFTGGELVFPRWRIAIAFKPGDLLLFDPQQVHGNLPMKGERLSAAFYCARRIAA